MNVADSDLSFTCEVCLNERDSIHDDFFTIRHDVENGREKMRQHMREEHSVEEIMDAAMLEEL